METNISRKSILEELEAVKKELKALASGKGTTEIQVDEHVEAAACIMDKARAALEAMHAADMEKAGTVGHQLRIMNMMNYLDGYGASFTSDEVTEALAPMAFDPVTRRMFESAMMKGGRDYSKTREELNEIYAPYDARRSAISVLKAQAAELRGISEKVGTAALVKNGAVEKLFDAFVQALEGWNEDLTRFG